MTERYISALNYADNKAAAIFKKYSKKRPLGDIESKYGYTPPQPVLSCRTVDVDLNGTRTYRPRSSTDILQEQHKLIHNIYTKNRNIKSAPQKQKLASSSETNFRKLQRINIEVQGRPLTSLSQISKTETIKSSIKLSKRPKTTGSTKTPKPAVTDAFLLIRVDRDVLESTRSSKELTNKIHDLWLPENHDLNQGKYIRGQKKAQNGPEQFNAWLTFGGTQNENEQGVVDAFTGISNYDEYYSIDGTVGSRVAATLKKGDKVRIGINGVVQSHSPRVKKTSIKPTSKYETDLFGEDISAFDEIILENFDEAISNKKKSPDETPLNWTDQVSKTDVKVVETIGKTAVPSVVNLCESHPVVFERLVKCDERPKLARGNTNGFKVQHRFKKTDGNQKLKYEHVKNIAIDSKSETENKNVINMTLEDVLRNTIAQRNRYNMHHYNFQKDKIKCQKNNEQNKLESAKIVDINIPDKKHVHINSCKSRGSTSGELSSNNIGNLIVPVTRSVPSTFTSTIDSEELMVIAPGVRQYSPTNEMSRNSKTPSGHNSTPTKSRSRISSAASHKPSLISADAEYIKFSSHIKNPHGENHNPSPTHKSSAGVRFVQDLSELESNISLKHDPDVDVDSGGWLTDRSMPSQSSSPPPVATLHGFSINIPTADMLSDRDSMLQSPYKRREDEEHANRKRKDIDMRDEQISQITSMLAGSVVN